MVALAYFAFSGKPIFGFVTGLEPTALGQQVCQTADLFFDVDRDEIGAGFALHNHGFTRRLGGGNFRRLNRHR